jgi:integrase
MRKRRGGVEDRWYKTVKAPDGTTTKVPSKDYGKGSRWRSRYVDDHGIEHQKNFARKLDAHRWLDGQTTALGTGRHVAPRDAQITVAQWCATWRAGYRGHRDNSVEGARKHINRIVDEFGDVPLSALRPSMVKAWIAKLQAEGLSATYVSLLHRRLSQVCTDAIHDGLLGHNPCSRRTSPPMGRQKPYCATSEQIEALHDAMPEHLKVAILLGAFAGLRISEACGLRITDVNFMRGVVHPVQQYGGKPLKTDGSAAPIPVPDDLALMLSASVARYGTDMMVTDGNGRPCRPQRLAEAIRQARGTVEGLPEGFSFHDLRHFFASLLIASRVDIKTVQARMRHAKAAMTLDTYAHLLPDADESSKEAVSQAIAQWRMAR